MLETWNKTTRSPNWHNIQSGTEEIFTLIWLAHEFGTRISLHVVLFQAQMTAQWLWPSWRLVPSRLCGLGSIEMCVRAQWVTTEKWWHQPGRQARRDFLVQFSIGGTSHKSRSLTDLRETCPLQWRGESISSCMAAFSLNGGSPFSKLQIGS